MMMAMLISARRVFPAVKMVDRLPRAEKDREPGKVASRGGVGKNLFFGVENVSDCRICLIEFDDI